MRKLAYIDIFDEIRKLIIYQSDEGVFLFGYDCLQDTSSKWDNWFMNVEEADAYCHDIYKVEDDKWIYISDPLEHCQHDFIMPTRVKGREIENSEYGKFETLIDGKWVELNYKDKIYSLDGLTGNERLFVTGLIDEFDKAKKNDKSKARLILYTLKFDDKSIERIA
jgi:biofilm protein TabA